MQRSNHEEGWSNPVDHRQMQNFGTDFDPKRQKRGRGRERPRTGLDQLRPPTSGLAQNNRFADQTVCRGVPEEGKLKVGGREKTSKTKKGPLQDLRWNGELLVGAKNHVIGEKEHQSNSEGPKGKTATKVSKEKITLSGGTRTTSNLTSCLPRQRARHGKKIKKKSEKTLRHFILETSKGGARGGNDVYGCWKKKEAKAKRKKKDDRQFCKKSRGWKWGEDRLTDQRGSFTGKNDRLTFKKAAGKGGKYSYLERPVSRNLHDVCSWEKTNPKRSGGTRGKKKQQQRGESIEKAGTVTDC